MISIGSYSYPGFAAALLSLLVALLATTMAEARNAHFTMEFIPTFKNGLPHKCHPDEIKMMETFLGDILAKETGMVEHAVEYLDRMYDANGDGIANGIANANGNANGNANNRPTTTTTTTNSASHAMKRHLFSKVRGFDFTFDCPTQGDHYVCPDNDWCHVLCLDESVRPGHVSLTHQASDLKEKLHSHSKTLEGPSYNVRCLGHTAELDFHLLVSVSP